ncbi:MAG TPA: dsRBD fold-containing protein [Candidatus Limnocylindria bacterium]|nr:dsRBD fold-containing protein [Candidatus Limnocylindria bacterium]
MKASVGDRIVVASAKVDGPVRDGTVVELRNEDGSPPYRVRWTDGAEPVLFFPGSDAHVIHPDASQPTAPVAEGRDVGSETRHVRSWQVRIDLFESGTETSAHAVLSSDQPTGLDGRGEAHRHPGDPNVPEIGDEIAVARALRRLSDRLLGTAAADIEAIEGKPITLPG